MDQTNALVPQKVSAIDTAAHEAMHAAMFIYKTIECLESRGRLDLLDDVLDWTLTELTIIENEAEGSAGCFYHRNYSDYTKDAHIYSCVSGFIGGYMFLGADRKNNADKRIREKTGHEESESHACYLEHELRVDMIGWLLKGDFKKFEGIKHEYKTFGSEGDLEATLKHIEKDQCRDCIARAYEIVKTSNSFKQLFIDILEEVTAKHQLFKDDLVAIANKHKDDIILASYIGHKITCVSLNSNGRAVYTHYL